MPFKTVLGDEDGGLVSSEGRKGGRPRVSSQVVDRIKALADVHPDYGCERIAQMVQEDAYVSPATVWRVLTGRR